MRRHSGVIAAAALAVLAPLTALAGPLAGTSQAQQAGPAAGTQGGAAMAAHADTSRKDGRLRAGCHDYGFRYRIEVPDGPWMLEVTLVDRRGEKIASGGVMSGSDPTSGRDHFRFCRANTVPGKFKIRGYLTYGSGDDQRAGRISPTRFRLSTRA